EVGFSTQDTAVPHQPRKNPPSSSSSLSAGQVWVPSRQPRRPLEPHAALTPGTRKPRGRARETENGESRGCKGHRRQQQQQQQQQCTSCAR
ncbi:unnamed protein product, partial [Pylaiella littoralis]